MAMTKTVEMGTHLRGVAQIARELGVRREWVWMVRMGRGKSARVEAALKSYGISVASRK
jgi:hypothetical protein